MNVLYLIPSFLRIYCCLQITESNQSVDIDEINDNWICNKKFIIKWEYNENIKNNKAITK